MQSYLDCIPCFTRQGLDACRMITTDEQRIRHILPCILSSLAGSDLNQPPPVIVSAMHRIIRQELATTDPYKALKKKSTEKARSLVPEAERLIASAENQFEAAVRFAIAGNILDFGAKTAWNETSVRESFTKAMDVPLKYNRSGELYAKLEDAETVLFLGDNAGEAVFDRLLIEHFPGNARVYYAVKGAPVINDATREDAEEAGIEAVAEIVDNGTDIPGTHLPACSESFRELFSSADVVVSKGQGNFETLLDSNRTIFFLLQIKCESLAKRNSVSCGDWIVHRIH